VAAREWTRETYVAFLSIATPALRRPFVDPDERGNPQVSDI
jgi:hypothetical protein